MNSGRLIILRVASLLEGRDAQNESYRAATARQAGNRTYKAYNTVQLKL